ncbi:MAG TPA: ABC transporter ATP-binding protein [Gemmatimonadaceae bacterium]|jgi:ATP-binding cassette subfamily B protein|nr:ABC transporter ATP-binding protein [Gemmatimonadaceae bacterium]
MKALRPLLPYLRRYRTQVIVGLLFVVGSSAVTSVIPTLIEWAIDDMRAGSGIGRIWGIAGAMVAIALFGGWLRYGMREVLNGVSRRIEYDLRNDLFQHLETLDASYFGHTRTGDIMARLTNDLSAVRMAAGPAIMYLFATIAGGLFALAFMLRISPMLTGISLLPMVLLPVMMVRFGRIIHERFEAVQDHFSTMTTHAQENFSGTRIIRAYRQEAAELGRFGALNDEYLRRNMHLVRLNGAMNPAFGLLAGLAWVVVLGLGGILTMQGTISVGKFVAFGMYLSALTWPLIALGWVINLFERGAASMTRLMDIFRAEARVTSPAQPRLLPITHQGRSIEFRNVSFAYPGTTRVVLRDISFFVPAGATLGIVGATASGKSALIDLIPRIYDPQEGEILIDGVPIREVPLDDLRRTIGVVPQESLLFSDTISANLVYGDNAELVDERAAEEAPDEDAGRWAARIAQLDETISAFPAGYDTMLGERGINLSGGQKQRAALARALARRPSIVLLDDALSAVDTHTEAAILHALRDAVAGRTAVIASHRISAIRDASWIVVLDEGRIVEQGRHEDLLALGGRYWSLLRRQQLVEALEGAA